MVRAAQVLPFVVVMLLTGTANTILTKIQNDVVVAVDEKGNPETYDQAVWQTATMFMGECFCFVYYAIFKCFLSRQMRKWYNTTPEYPFEPSPVTDGILGIKDAESRAPLSGARQLLMFIPSLLDAMGTCTMMVGFQFCAPSVFQMLRGFLVVVTTIFNVVFLGARFALYKWIAVLIICCGIFLVSYASMTFAPAPADDAAGPRTTLFGVGLVLFAQLFPATQFIVEEKILSKYAVAPVKAIGLEGIGGLLVCVTGVPILGYFLSESAFWGHYFDYETGFRQTWVEQPTVIYTNLGILFSISCFNFTGLAIARMLNSATRSTIDSFRVVTVWLAGLALSLEIFIWQQIPGFLVLTLGTFIFNDVIPFPGKPKAAAVEDKEEVVQPFLQQDNLDAAQQAAEGQKQL